MPIMCNLFELISKPPVQSCDMEILSRNYDQAAKPPPILVREHESGGYKYVSTEVNKNNYLLALSSWQNRPGMLSKRFYVEIVLEQCLEELEELDELDELASGLLNPPPCRRNKPMIYEEMAV